MFALDRLLAVLRRPGSAPSAGRGEAGSAYDVGVRALARGDAAAALARFDATLAELRGSPDGAGLDRPAAVRRAAIANKRGVALVALGRRDEALAAFCDALDADERAAPALVNLGNLLVEDGHASDAVDYYRSAIACDDGYAPAYRNLGIALKRLGRRGEAVGAFRAAVRREAKRNARS